MKTFQSSLINNSLWIRTFSKLGESWNFTESSEKIAKLYQILREHTVAVTFKQRLTEIFSEASSSEF